MVTDPLRSVIRELEERLMQTHVRNTRALAAPLLADEFVEFGSSGGTYDKEAVLSALAADTSAAPAVANFAVRQLAPGIVLATYRTVHRDPSGTITRQSLRSSVWREVNGRWQLEFHQGTPTENV